MHTGNPIDMKKVARELFFEKRWKDKFKRDLRKYYTDVQWCNVPQVFPSLKYSKNKSLSKYL